MQGWVRSIIPSVLNLAVAVLVAIPAAIALTPAHQTTVAGQDIGVAGTTPTFGWFGGWQGPARLKQIGETVVDLQPIQVRGPLRPQLELGPLVRDDDVTTLLDPRHGPRARTAAIASVTGAFRDWYLLASVLVVLLTLALVAVSTSAQIWFVMTRASRHRTHLAIRDVWHGLARRLRIGAVVAVIGTMSVWLGVGVLAWHDTAAGLSGISSPRDLVGAAPVHLHAAGPETSGYAGAVIGDSRVSRLGGPQLADPSPQDAACARSTDSLAAELTLLSPSDRVLNLACPGASISDGLLGTQQRGGLTLQPQVARLLNTHGLRFVAVMIGPNDLDWTDFIRYCYAFAHCDDRLSSGQFDYRLANFDRDYGDLLAALATVPDHPQIIVIGSYDVFAPGADCADTKGPAGVPGLGTDDIALLAERNGQLNAVLRSGAQAYGFGFVVPQLATLCQGGDSQIGGDLQGLEDPAPFHPTGVGMIRLAASVFAAIHETDEATPSPAAAE